MKKFHKANLGFVAGVALLGYGAGLVSVTPSNADPKDSQTGRGFGGGPAGPRAFDGEDQGGPADGRGPGGPSGPGGGMGGRGGGPGGRGGGRGMVDGKASGPMLDRLLEDLQLTDSQYDKIENARENERAQIEVIRKQIEQVQKKTRSSIDSVLTTDQRKQLEAAEKEMAAQNSERGGQGRQGRGPGAGGQGGPGRGGPGGERQGGNRPAPRDDWDD